MQTALRKMGNSTGMIIPKAILAELGVESGAAMTIAVENGRVVATPVKAALHNGWAAAAAVIGSVVPTESESDWLADGDDLDDWTW